MHRYCLGLFVVLGTAWGAHAHAHAQDTLGAIQGTVFNDESHLPLGEVVLRLAREGDQPVVVTSQGDGAFALQLLPGVYELVLDWKGVHRGAFSDLVVVAGEVTELIVRVPTAGVAKIEVEAPPVSGANAAAEDLAPGVVDGVVRSLEDSMPVQSAQVFVRGADAEARTDAIGAFRLELIPGVYDLTVVAVGLSTQTIAGHKVVAGETSNVLVEMTPAGLKLEAFTVSTPHVAGGTASLLAERRDSATVSDVLGAEQMARSGDSDAAGALTRVTGLTLIDGKFVYIRGLGDRYSSALLNGSTLPSPEPERRVIPLDVFPVGLLESVVIPKTYTPDLPGEFGGGSIQLRTRAIPEGPVRQVSLSVGGQPGTTFEPGLTYQGGGLDWLGFDDGTRSLPGPVDRASRDTILREADRFSDAGYSAEELEGFGESVPNIWAIRRRSIRPNMRLSATVGDRATFGSTPVGYLAAVTFSNGWNTQTERQQILNVGAAGALDLANQYRFERTTNDIILGTVLNLGAELSPRHHLAATTTLARQTSNETRIYEGPNADVDTVIQVNRLRWIERMLLSQQFKGNHELMEEALDLEWRYTFSWASRSEPDRREYRYDLEDITNRFLLSDRPEGNQRVYSDLGDFNQDLAVAFTFPVPGFDEEQAKIEIGSAMILKDRTVDTRRFKFLQRGPRSNDEDVLALPPEEVFAPENIGVDGFQFEEITRQTDNYSANQRIYAGYAMADFKPMEDLRIVAGTRFEHTAQNVATFELFNPDSVPVEADLANSDFLPALLATWSLTGASALRFATSRTVSRPEFRELSTATFNDVTGGRQVFGNPDLKRATITHADVRWEWFPSSSEVISLGAFYKDFREPIETVVVVSAQQSVSFANAESARNIGLEFEARKWLDFVHPALSDFYLATNGAIISSKVTLRQDEQGQAQTSSERALQGQSPFVVNAEGGYHDVDTGMQVALLYNVFGRRISEVGATGAPDIFQEPVHRVDATARVELEGGWRLTAKGRNLLNPRERSTQGGVLTSSTRRGRSFSVGLAYEW